MCAIMNALLVFLLLASSGRFVVAFPGGSPVCTVGTSAPNPTFHGNLTGSLSNGNFTVLIGNVTLKANETTTIPAGTNLTLNVTSLSGELFKGVLVVLNQDGEDLSTNLVPLSSDVKVQADCAATNYSGFTHVANSTKTSVAGLLTVTRNLTAYLDVNVVVANRREIPLQVYYYTRFTVKFVQPAPPPPTRAPTKAPTAAPVKPERCGLFGLNIICIFRGCGFFRRLFGLCK
jgi:hypothetical protein